MTAPPTDRPDPSTTQVPGHPAETPVSALRRRRSLIGVTLGNGLEVFDWTCYAVFAPFFAKALFNPANATSALLSTLVVFGVGFAIRPFGGLLFGWMADRFGRKHSLLVAIACASTGMLLIGLTPTYASVGVLSGAILLAARLLQGLAHTGEVAAAYTYIAEEAPPARRGLWSSSIYISGFLAIMAATIMGALLTTALSDHQMATWGWRLPFLIGAALGLITLYLRRGMDETHAFTSAAAKPASSPSLLANLWTYRASGTRVFLLMASVTAMFYAWAVSGPTWAISVAHIDPTAALWAGVIALGVSASVLPLLGSLSDRIGRRRSFYIYGFGVAVTAFPLDHLARQGAWQFGLGMTIALVLFAFVASILPAVLSELFPIGVRASGIAMPYALSAVVFGGTAPYLQQWTAQHNVSYLFVGYLASAALLGALVMRFTPETAGISLEPSTPDTNDQTQEKK
ncbi:MFS transporter [Rhodococcus sp. MSC1_016]|jgi:MHS family alpha-ketoglutarate permease-like MFS transporter|uniref:MFS transporter n=1 Tax=Rhodococcus sp. MSC1_016 TaxID=2909266 RepID=UPI002030D553|nr:MFS transporter [Rhodococcus sp. MSC1_016]